MKSSHLSCLIGNAGLLWSPCWGIAPHLELICSTRSSFLLLPLLQGPSNLVTAFLGSLWSSIKEVKAHFVFDGEHAVALHAMQGNQASFHGEGEVSWILSNFFRNLGYILT